MKLSRALEIIEKNSCRISEMEEWTSDFIGGIVENLEQLSNLNWNNKEALEILLGKEIGKEANYENNEELLNESPWLKVIVEYYKTLDIPKKELQKRLDACTKIEDFFSEFDI